MEELTPRMHMKRAIAASRNTFTESLRDGDSEAAAMVYADSARLVAPSAELIEGRAAIRAYWQAGIDAGVYDIELEAGAVRPKDGMAYEVGRYLVRVRPDAGETIVDRGRYVLVLEQGGDRRWRRVVEMFSPESMPHAEER